MSCRTKSSTFGRACCAVLAVAACSHPPAEPPTEGQNGSPVAFEAEETCCQNIFHGEFLRREIDYEIGHRDATIRSQELDPDTGTWHQYEELLTTSFEILDVDSRGADQIFVLGRARNGDSVIERWILSAPTGSWSAVRPVPATPAGQTLLQPTTLQVTLVGGAFVLPGSRSSTGGTQREELCRGSDYGAIVDAVVEPEGRVLYFLADTPPVLGAILLQAEDTPSFAFWTEQVVPELATAETHYFLKLTDGSWILVTSHIPDDGDPIWRSVYRDTNNDGFLDQTETTTYEEYKAVYPPAVIDYGALDTTPK